MNITRFTKFSNLTLALLLMVIGALAFHSLRIQDEIYNNERHRFRALLLADELLQSSDDLTRMARTYVTTGEPRYEHYFNLILDIRNGLRPRPTNYSATYWHLATAGKTPVVEQGEPLSLIEMFRQENLSHEESALLEKSLELSDQLVKLERQAFAAIKGLYDDGMGNFTVPGRPDREFAIKLLFGERYIAEKASIVEPIQQLIDVFNERMHTRMELGLKRLEHQSMMEIGLIVIAVLATMAILVYSRRVILKPLAELSRQVTGVTRGSRPGRYKSAPDHEVVALSQALALADAEKKQLLENERAARNEAEQANQAKDEFLAVLNRSLAMLQAVIESIADGILVTDENGNLICYNELYVDMWRMPRELLEAGKHPLLIDYCSNHLKDPRQFQRLTKEIYAIWPPESFDMLDFNDGRVFERYTKIKNVEGQDVGRVWSFRDVTQRKQAEAYTAQLAAIVESSYDAIIVKDLNGIITSWNAGAERIFGYRAEEIVGCSIFGLIPGDRLQEESKIMSLIKSGKPLDHFETVRLGKDGRLIDVSVTISPMKDSGGNIIGASKVARDITQRKEAQERIQHLAHYDALTELPNRALLADRIKTAIAHADRYSHRLALLFVDLDRFKLVNDSLGHEIGDKLLKVVAERMQSSVREADTISRVGGDEFVILLSQIDSLEDAAGVARKIISALSQPHQIEGHELMVSASVGISIYPDSAKDASSLMRNADSSMYCAKEAGRNRYQFYSVELTSRATERLSLERDLRSAVEHNEIFVVYQPQIELMTRRVIGAEALMRWRHPKRGLVPPASFIPVAEDTGLILPLGEHVLRESCLQARRWHDCHGIDVGIAVNVSSVQFRQEDFVDVVLRILEETGLAAGHLELEVTESVVMQGVESVIQKMRILNAKGIKVAIDDFGTGYSSLSYLRRFVADRLKIDQSFVRDLQDNPDAEAIVRAIVAMGRSLGLRVIAEGVETKEQAAFLQSIECDEGQGFLYAKPMVGNEFEAWLAERTAQAGAIQFNCT